MDQCGNADGGQKRQDQRQFEWVDGRLTTVEEVVKKHDVSITQLVELVPEIKKLIRWSYILLGFALAVGLILNAPQLAHLAVSGLGSSP